MAGPAIRAWEMAKAIHTVAEVRLVSTVAADLTSELFPVSHADESELRSLVAWCDVLVFQGHTLASYPWIKRAAKIIVADIYDPMHLEQLEQTVGMPEERRLKAILETAEVLNDQIERADFMMCASDKQRDFWLGQLAAVFRINPLTYGVDASLRSLLSVVPFGIQDEAPVQRAHGIKGVVPGISESDKVILWGGGIYNWFDPITLIEAVEKLSATRDDVRLFFLGAGHPNRHVPAMEMVTRARDLARQRGLDDRVVFFHDDWVPYEERADFLLDADLGASTHFDHLETAFSFRTRILDYLWASLPIVTTAGDTFAGLVQEHGLGRVVPPTDADTLAGALESLLYDDEAHAAARTNIVEFAETMRWRKVLRPLLEFVVDPRPAPDSPLTLETPRNRIVNDLRVRIAGMESSTSWRMTAPVRAAKDLLRRPRGR
ncbi:glycosyltransferase [uncultured Leifsonia sp.]|uniref:glycosyltransferase n=1 Tax=uncultured Leifsonia sp. TaxID=340359 RepID=UPI0025E6B241|nr:glycosyltransferase [uncultured Leifsonia sp.]